MITKRLRRLLDYWKDKRLADKCGLKVKDICVHENDFQKFVKENGVPLGISDVFKCLKCGEFYR